MGYWSKIATFIWMSIIIMACAFSQEEQAIDVYSLDGPSAQPIAIPVFDGTDYYLAQQISQVIADDLTRYGLFKLVDPAAYLDQTPADQKPNFASWRAIDAVFLARGKVEVYGSQVSVEFRLWDTILEEQKVGMQYSADYDAWRSLAHTIADAIYKEVIGSDGYFNTRIVYIAESGPANNLQRRLAIMDQDGANHAYLTDGSGLVLTPRFSPTSQEITYISYESGEPKVYLLDINTGRREILGSFIGMTFAPRFSPDGNSVVLSQAVDGETNIFIVNLRTYERTQLTSGPAIDTAPSYSPDGRHIVFESDRDGSQQLYIMDIDGGNVRRISFGKGRYATPVWSPGGDLIAYTRIYGGKFYIGVIQPDGKNDRLLTKDYLVEAPTWSPNGQVIVYTRQSSSNAQRQLYGIDVTGFYETLLPTPSDASDPAWSPNM